MKKILSSFAACWLLLFCISTPLFSAQTHLVSRVIDGCTIQLENGDIVKLIGVDSPTLDDVERSESMAARLGVSRNQYFSHAAKAKKFLAELVEGQEIKLEYDSSNADLGHKDQYGQILAYLVPANKQAQQNFLRVWRARLDQERMRQAELFGIQLGGTERIVKKSASRGDNVKASANVFLVLFGFSPVPTESTFDSIEKFKQLEMRAKLNERGIWGVAG